MTWESVPFDAHISIISDGVELHSTYVKNVGTMENTKRLATKFANSKDFKCKDIWLIECTDYAESSGLHGSWESEGQRECVNIEKQIRATLKILRS